jgi:2'-5' RNA ligase
MQTLRTFIAVELESHVRDRAARLIERLRAAPARVKWVEAENLHFTLSFLGDVEAQEIPDVCEAASRAAAQSAAFEFEVRGLGAFPDARRPRTVWLGAGRGEAQMVALHDRLQECLRPLGFRPDARRYRPHLTIGRVRDGNAALAELASLLAEHREYEGGLMYVSEMAVMSSQLTRNGPLYERLHTAELAGR